MKPRNVLILCSDEHARSALGCYGHPLARTPTLDRLARLGTRFSRAYTPSPSCVPARACLATGTHVHELTVVPFRPQVADGEVVGNAQEPRDNGRAALLVTADGLPRFEEGLSGEVFGLSGITYQIVNVAVHAHDVTVVQLGEGGLVFGDSPVYEATLFITIGTGLRALRRLNRLRSGRGSCHR
jgi:hypothetical protein